MLPVHLWYLRSCLIAAGRHPDVEVLTHRGAFALRSNPGSVPPGAAPPLVGRTKVYILLEAGETFAGGSQPLLKTLEERRRIQSIFIAEHKQALLPTVVSVWGLSFIPAPAAVAERLQAAGWRRSRRT